jgi:hypothetical protein
LHFPSNRKPVIETSVVTKEDIFKSPEPDILTEMKEMMEKYVSAQVISEKCLLVDGNRWWAII